MYEEEKGPGEGCGAWPEFGVPESQVGGCSRGPNVSDGCLSERDRQHIACRMGRRCWAAVLQSTSLQRRAGSDPGNVSSAVLVNVLYVP